MAFLNCTGENAYQLCSSTNVINECSRSMPVALGTVCADGAIAMVGDSSSIVDVRILT